jgi:hypothetical protein
MFFKAFRYPSVGTAIKAFIALLEGVALLVADEHHPIIANAGKARAHGPVVANGTVTVEFDELLKNEVDIIHCLRSLGMARNQDRVPSRQVHINLPFQAD